jgi:hypothetical protein
MSKRWLGVTHGMKGWFAVLYDDAGPIDSGDGYPTIKMAKQDAKAWAIMEVFL